MDIKVTDLTKEDLKILSEKAVPYVAEDYKDYWPHKREDKEVYEGGIVVYVYNTKNHNCLLEHKFTLPANVLPLKLSKVTIYMRNTILYRRNYKRHNKEIDKNEV